MAKKRKRRAQQRAAGVPDVRVFKCLRGAATTAQQRTRGPGTGKTRGSRLAKSVSLVGVSDEAMKLAQVDRKCDVAHVLIVCRYRDEERSTKSGEAYFGVKLDAATAVEFFESGLRMAWELKNGEEQGDA